MEFKDKTVIITGGSEGVGAAAARMFADAGANLVLAARTRKNLEAVARELCDKTRVEIFAIDVSDADACADLLKKADFEFGRVDVLINNAGYHKRGRFDSVDPDDLARMIDVNLRAPIVLTRLALSYLRESGDGVIINVGSAAGRSPYPNGAVYGASKAGLRMITYALAEEFKSENIRIAVVSPGPIVTGFMTTDFDNVADINFAQPLSTPEEVAEVIFELCSDKRTERSIPRITAVLTTLNYLFPRLGRVLRPMLERKGARVRKQLKADLQKLPESGSQNRQR